MNSEQSDAVARAVYLGSPRELMRLRSFGQLVERTTGHTVFIVGSVLHRLDFRDVDLRVMLDDEQFEAVFGGDGLWVTNGALTLLNMALSALAREMSGGLDVDFQFQRLSDANAVYGDKPRHALRWPPPRVDEDELIPSPLARQR